MAAPSIDIDRVVREVLAELDAAPSNDDHEPVISDLVISCRVVTLAEVEGRLGGIRRLVVPLRAVVTPAVRDELQRKNVTLAYESPVASKTAEPLRLVVVTAGKSFDPTALLGALSREAVEVQPHMSDCLIAASDQLAGEVKRPDTLGLLLTRHPAAALCLANRHPGVRAISGPDTATVSKAAGAVGANLLVIDPTAQSGAQLKRITTEFCRGGTRPCPEVFQQRLG